MKKRIIIYICLFQLTIIGVLFSTIFNKKGTVSVQKVLGTTYDSSEEGELMFFFEPDANTIQTDDLSWMGNEHEYSVKYKINSEALNQMEEVTLNKPKNTFRIVSLGTSFTFGSYVNTEENYSSQMQQILDKKCSARQKFEVLNLGVSGYDINYASRRFLLRGVNYEPDLVVWFFTDPDFLRFTDKLRPVVATILREKNITPEAQFISGDDYYPVWKEANKKIIKALGGEKQALQKQEKYINRLVNSHTGTIVFAGQHLNDRNKRLLESIMQTSSNVYFDNSVTHLYDTDYELPDHHPNSMGHKVIAEDIINYLISSKLIQCN